MIKYYILLLFPAFCFAQPTITENIVLPFDTRYKAQYIENPIFDPGPSGENQTWDFTDLQGQFEFHFNILDPSTTPDSDKFPGASFVWNFEEFEFFFYYDVNEDSLSQMGNTVSNGEESTFLVVNTNWEDALQFPITYQTAYDYFTEYDNFLFGSYLNSGQRSGTFLADGYGTIITPYGTYSNVIRAKIVTQEFGFTNTQYAWMTEDSFIPVLVYEFSDDVEEIPSLYYADIDKFVSNTNEPTIDLFSVSFQSATQSLHIKTSIHPQNLDHVRLLDMNGRLLDEFSLDIHSVESGYSFQLNNTVSHGIYIVQILYEGKSMSKPIYIFP